MCTPDQLRAYRPEPYRGRTRSQNSELFQLAKPFGLDDLRQFFLAYFENEYGPTHGPLSHFVPTDKVVIGRVMPPDAARWISFGRALDEVVQPDQSLWRVATPTHKAREGVAREFLRLLYGRGFSSTTIRLAASILVDFSTHQRFSRRRTKLIRECRWEELAERQVQELELFKKLWDSGLQNVEMADANRISRLLDVGIRFMFKELKSAEDFNLSLAARILTSVLPHPQEQKPKDKVNGSRAVLLISGSSQRMATEIILHILAAIQSPVLSRSERLAPG